MASDADVGDDPPPRGGGSPGIDGRSVRSSGTDPPPNTPSVGSFLDRSSSFLRRSVMNITSRQQNVPPKIFQEFLFYLMSPGPLTVMWQFIL